LKDLLRFLDDAHKDLFDARRDWSLTLLKFFVECFESLKHRDEELLVDFEQLLVIKTDEFKQECSHRFRVTHDIQECLGRGISGDQLQIGHGKFQQGHFLSVSEEAFFIA